MSNPTTDAAEAYAAGLCPDPTHPVVAAVRLASSEGFAAGARWAFAEAARIAENHRVAVDPDSGPFDRYHNMVSVDIAKKVRARAAGEEASK